ncbi:hypothetical protein KJ359_007837 [Pestalotiopsis sp. 9143b]|nr:hypothetical protein KJ359_007837 [Pestalotiopsis sp. 9143b]
MVDHQSRSLEQQLPLDLSDKNLVTSRKNNDGDEKIGDQNCSSFVGCRHKSDAGAAHVFNGNNKELVKLVIDIDTDDEVDMNNDIPLLVAGPLPADVKFPTKNSKIPEYQKGSQKLINFLATN